VRNGKNVSLQFRTSHVSRLTSNLASHFTHLTSIDIFILILIFISTLLLIFPEFFYLKDIYPAHYRANTMFKLGYQAFMMMSLVSGYVITRTVVERKKNRWFLAGLAPLLFLVSIYPYFSVNSYFGRLKTYQGLYGRNSY